MNLQLPESLKISSLHFVHSRYGNKGLQKMLVTIRKHSKGAILDAPDELYVVAIKSIDEYLLRARDTHGGWNKGLIASNHGDKSSDKSNLCLGYSGWYSQEHARLLKTHNSQLTTIL